MRRVFGIVLLILLMSACAGAKKKPDVHASYLQKITTVDYSVIWAERFEEYGLDRFSKLYPSVADGIVYRVDPEGMAMAISLSTGEIQWRADLGVTFTAGPVVANDLLFAATRNGELLCLRRADGVVVWRTEVSSEVLAPPQVAEGVVVVQTIDGKLQGLGVEDGELLWTFDRRVPSLSLRGTSQPIIVDEFVVAGFSNGKLVVLSLHDGKLSWESAIAVPRGRSELERMVDIDGFFAYRDGTLYVATYNGRIAAVTIESGRILWTRDMSSYLGLSLGERELYAIDTDGRIWALDIDSGATLWMQDRLQDRGATTPVIYGDTVVIGDKNGALYWLSKADGRILVRLPYKTLAEKSGVINPADIGRVPDAYSALIYQEDQGVVNKPWIDNGNIVVTYRNGVTAALRAKL